MSIYQLVVKAVFNGTEDFRNIHHYEFPGYVPTLPELTEAVQALADAYEEIMLPSFSSVNSFKALDARRVDIGDQPTQEIVPAGWPLSGTGVGNSMPPQVSMLVTWKAPTAFPRSTRTYLFPFVVATGSPGGAINLPQQTAAGVFQLALEQLAITAQPDAQKVAVQYGGVPRVVTASNIVFASPITNIFATQRSRRYGVGI